MTSRADIIEAMARAISPDPDYWEQWAGVAERSLDALGKLAAVVKREPTDALLRSMALRYDHAVFAPVQTILGETEESKRAEAEATIATMRQLHEEVVGTGFYRNADLTQLPQAENPFHLPPSAADLTVKAEQERADA